MFLFAKLCTNNTMEQIAPREVNRSSGSQEIPHILLKQKVHYRTHKSPQTLSFLSQIQSVPSVPLLEDPF